MTTKPTREEAQKLAELYVSINKGTDMEEGYEFLFAQALLDAYAREKAQALPWIPVVDTGQEQPPLDFEVVFAWNPREARAFTGIFEHDGKFCTPYGIFYRRDFYNWMPMIDPHALHPKEPE